jgi:outer membrane receptor protein involved in Fe transport
MSFRTSCFVGASCLTLALTAQPAVAQDTQTPQQAPTASLADTEIIVTARRREENLQDVPAAITAIGGEELEEIGAVGIEDFTRLAPGLNLTDTGFFGFKTFRIRGIATGTSAAVLQAPVSLYLNDIQTVDPYIPQGTADFYLSDIDRVEVLRGPQGTLFGSGSLAGAVRVITRAPELGEFSGSIEGGYETVQDGGVGGGVEGVLNVPLGDRFAARVVGYGFSRPGWIDNTLTGADDTNSGELRGARATLRGDLTDNFSLTVFAAHQRDEYDSSFRTFVDGGAGGPREWSVLTSDARVGEASTVSITADWDFGWASLTSVSSYLKTLLTARGAFDYFSATLGLPGTPMWQDQVSDNTGYFQEFRLTSQTSGPVSYLVGANYSDRDITLAGLIRNPTAEGVFALPNLLDSNLDANITELALFGEVNFQMRSDLELSLGVRAFRNEFENLQTSVGLFTGFVLSSTGGSKTEEDVSPRVTLTWEPSDDLTIYGQVAKGYRIGQTNSSLDATLGTVPRSFGPDYLWNYEIGAKGDFWGGRGRGSLALFYIDWSDIQVQLPGTTGPYTDNAGAARVVGLETELSFALTDSLELQNSMAITEAELAEDLPNFVQSSGVVGIFEGDPLPGSTDFTMSTSLQYTRETANGGAFYARLDHQYVGESRNSFSSVNAFEFGDYHVFGASSGYQFANGVGLRVFAKNLGDDDSATNVLFGSPGLGYPAQAIRLQPRTVGVSLRREF